MLFLLGSVLVLNAVAFFIPKRLNKIEMYTTILFSAIFQMITDVVLTLKYDLYGYFDPGVDWRGFIPVVGLYPAFTVIYLNLYPFKKGVLRQSFYIAGNSVFAIVFEWLSVKSGYFYYKEWNLWYSALLYPGLLLTLTWNLRFIRKLEKS